MKRKRRPTPQPPLTLRQLRFRDLIVQPPFCAAKAARLAGYSERTARSQGARLLRHPHIAKAVELGLEIQAMEFEAAMLDQELRRLGSIVQSRKVPPLAKAQVAAEALQLRADRDRLEQTVAAAWARFREIGR